MVERRHVPDAGLPGDGTGFLGRQVVGRESQGTVPFRETRFDEELVSVPCQPKDLRTVFRMGSGIGHIGNRLSRSDA
jgi:hypothetical protein